MLPLDIQDTKRDIATEAIKNAIDAHKVPARHLLTALESVAKITQKHNDHIQMHESHMRQHQMQLDAWDSIVQHLTSITHLKGEPGKDGIGKPGRNGKSPRIEDIVAAVLEAMPDPEKGEAGKDAEFDADALYKSFIKRMKKEKALDISNIGNAQSFLFNGKRYKTEELMKGGGPILTGRGSIQSYDISSQFDGVSTTFTIPQYLSIVQFIITGWPPNGVLRPTVDFTTPSSTTVSLVPASVTAPASGTSGIILYVAA